jgi:hypothetical protein
MIRKNPLQRSMLLKADHTCVLTTIAAIIARQPGRLQRLIQARQTSGFGVLKNHKSKT